MEGKGFVNAGYLKAGDEVRLESGEEAYIEWIEVVPLDEPIKVYNFEVEDFHTYYVSAQKVLVHNSCKDETVEKAKDTPLHLSGKDAEAQLAEMVGGEQQKYFNTSQNARYIDSYAEGIAHEAKTGYTVASKRIIKQIEKDAGLMKNTIDGAVWHFFRSKTTGKIGASRKVKQLLDKYHIGYIEHD